MESTSPSVNPVVSVIVTVYDRTRYLREALQAVLAQTLPSFEVIVTADSANEEIRNVCESLGHPAIRYRRNPQTLGVALNLRAALSEAKGRYIAILNDDDAWEPTFLEKLTAALDADPRRVLAFSDHWVMDEDSRVDAPRTDRISRHYGRDRLPEGEVAGLPDFVLKENGVPLAMGSLFRRDAVDLDLIVPEVSGAYDFWIACLLAGSGRPAYYVPDRLTRYRIHPEMETKRLAPDKQENLVYIYRTLLERNTFPDRTTLVTGFYSQVLRNVGKDLLHFGQVAKARKYFRRSFAALRNVKTAVWWALSYLPPAVRSTLRLS